MQLSIAIVSWNTKRLLRQCLSSVFGDLDGLTAEVIVVDNGSSDDSAGMVRCEFPQVRLIEAGENLGFTRANNLAYKESSGDCFLLLNSDTVVLPGALPLLVRFMESNPAAGAVGSKLLNGDGTLQRSCSPFPTPLQELFDALYLSKLFPENRLTGSFAMSYWDFSSVREVDFAGGSCLLLRRAALEEIGLLDEGFFMYSEEADLCYRLKEAGWKVFFYPDARVIHYGGQSSKLDVNRTSVELCRSKHRFMRKHYGLPSAAAYRAVAALSSVVRLAAWSPRAVVGRNRNTYKDRLSVQGRIFTWAVGAR
ncbi:MAG: glycosyltransferase family 2 protein [Armatimonadota bacterium]